MAKRTQTEVLYNAACPVCRREVDHYARLSEEHALEITYADLNTAEVCQDWGISPDDAARRLHVRKHGATYRGADAFVTLWRDIPRYRWLAVVVTLPGINRIAVWIYEIILAPWLYRQHKKRTAKTGSSSDG
jgi:predicted DCC family thiol-disulfide oxidoreductase YuxK